MTRTVTVDLDHLDHGQAERLWEAVKYRVTDSELREAIQERAARTGDSDLVAMVENGLDSSYPEDVLRAFWRELIPNRPALGSYPKPEPSASVDIHAWTVDRVRSDLVELENFTSSLLDYATDLAVVVRIALALAEEAGIEPSTAEKVVAKAIRRQTDDSK